MDSYNEIGQRVKSLRANRGFSQDELADGICSRQTISILENGLHLPSAGIMRQIAERLNIPLHEIMVDKISELETKVKVDILKVYVETRDYAHAFPIIEELLSRDDILEYLRRETVLCHAECLIRTGQADHATALLTDLQQIIESEREKDDLFAATVYDKLGTASYFLSNIAKAHAYYMRAYQITLRFPEMDVTAARIAYNLGKACRQLNHQSDAVEYLSRAESYFKGISDPSRLAQTMFELGIAYSFQKDYERADQYIRESLSLYRTSNVMDMARRVRQTHAFVVLSHLQPELAVQELINCAEEFEKSGDKVRYAYTNACIAYQLIKLENLIEAKKYLDISLNLFTQEEIENDFRLTFVYQVYSIYLLKIKDYDTCVEYSVKSSEFFDKMGFVREAADSLNLSAKSYEMQGMFKEAYEISGRVNRMLCRMSDQTTRMEVL